MDFGGRLFFLYELKEASLNSKIARRCLSWKIRNRVRSHGKRRNLYGALAEALRIERDFSSVNPEVVPPWVHQTTREYLARGAAGWRQLLISFRETDVSRYHGRKYRAFDLPDRLRIRQPKVPPPPERQGDLLVLKPWCGPQEKGVLFLNFDETVDKFFSLYDVERIASRYRIVVEPSAWGYQQARMYLLRGLDTDVVVEAQYRQDYEYTAALGGALKAIRLGAGDWADPELFRSGRSEEKKYDLVMIANWLKWKRHKLLFQAMRDLHGRIGRVALLGYPIEGRTSGEIRDLAARYGIAGQIDIYESIPAPEVARVIRSAKAGVMLSKKEGANRGIYECLFSDVPVILSSCNIGVNRDHINQMTGRLAADHELSGAILDTLERREQYQPRAWAIEHTGAENSSMRLNAYLKTLAQAGGESWTQDIFPKKNAPVPLYLHLEHRQAADREIDKLASCLLPDAR